MVFFFWPAGQALLQSFQQQDAFGTSTEWVGLENFERLFNDPSYLDSFKTTAVFSLLVAVFGICACRCCWRSSPTASSAARMLYKTLLIWPYAVAPAVAGVLWLFMFSPRSASSPTALRKAGLRLEPLLNGDHAMALIVMAAVWKQISYNFLFFLAGLQIDPELADRGRRHRRRRPWRRFWTIQFPLLSPTTFFLLVINMVYAFFDTFAIVDATTHGGPGQGHHDPGLQGLLRRLQGHGPRRLGGAVGRADGRSSIALTVVQFRFVEKKVNY